ncbi:hypothetical protein GE061_007681 [Apolygus lucorum]|uniref:Sodium channel protein Nach n=1 Tax=Apolygus lucorum TaxID=248454 RepID=A0A8S9WP57_APOLU|nr:hypothetical protein GE061_007681 [Apolygus lucorum]
MRTALGAEQEFWIPPEVPQITAAGDKGQRVQETMKRTYKDGNTKNVLEKVEKSRNRKPLGLKWLEKTTKEFGDTTTLHGIPYITKKNYHWSETFLWLLVVVAANSCAYFLIIESWVRYNDNPTVISIEKNFREWNVVFPAATVCFQQKMNETAAHYFIIRQWNTEVNSTEYFQHMAFLKDVTNVNYSSVGDLAEYAKMKDYASFKGADLSNIARQLMQNIEYTSKTELNLDFVPVVTEMGLCFAYAANVSYYHALQLRTIYFLSSRRAVISFYRNKPPGPFDIMTCNYSSSNCGIRIEVEQEHIRDLQFYIHGPDEIPDISFPPFTVKKREQLELMIGQFEIVSSPDIRGLRVRQRRCKFTDEPARGDKFYSYNVCKMNCRRRMMKEQCGCTPFFYVDERKENFCDLKGLGCVALHKDKIIKQIRNNTACPCLPMCNTVMTQLAGSKLTEWKDPAPITLSFSWTLEKFSKTRTKRSIIYRIDDLLVSFGGIAALFLGCSVISFVETINFFFLRSFWNLFSKRRRKNEIREFPDDSRG